MNKKLLVILLVVLVLIIGLLAFGLFAPKKEETVSTVETPREYFVVNHEVQQANGIEIFHHHIPYSSSRRPGEIREIKYITIHETDNRRTSADASAHDTFLYNDTNDITAWHYTVDDHSIVHHIPDNEIAWNAGDGRTVDGGNINGIGIEMCVNSTGDYEKTLDNTINLVVELLYSYNLTPDDVRLHAHFMDKVCPHRLITEGRVDEFFERINQAYLQKQS